MIQELLGEASAAGLIHGGETSKLSVNNNGFLGSSLASPSLSPCPSPSLSPSPSPSSSTITSTLPPPTASSTSESLRCPRCDSINTKFCYYNNYNLTQPRHFCKTCRRYWTKGGALRNVPIGGGCRKNKTATLTSSAVMKSSSTVGKFKTMATEMGKSAFLSSPSSSSTSNMNPFLWASSYQNSHLLSLLRANHNNPISTIIKEEAGAAMPAGSHMNSTVSLDARMVGLDSIGLRNNEQLQQQIGYQLGQEQSTGGVEDFYHRLRSSTTCYQAHAPVVMGNIVSSSSSPSSNMTILDSAPVAAAEPGYWNPIFSSWADLPTTNGAYPFKVE
ncbi:hypothetical protein ACH5RR_014100 [Cinchona calisaya]|uniref:Dof zinc finger protein n=1 Tax=Cinchona calisaya TaxID=153742 RepID=A0ABD3A3F2_9GENT